MNFTEEQKELLAKFQSKFTIRANSMASQEVEVTPTGTILYENTYVYGDAVALDIIDKRTEEIITSIHNPEDDMEALLQFAEKWHEQGYPMPGDDTDLFK